LRAGKRGRSKQKQQDSGDRAGAHKLIVKSLMHPKLSFHQEKSFNGRSGFALRFKESRGEPYFKY
jgi:hypothetical protein